MTFAATPNRSVAVSRRPPRASLTRERIARTALELTDKEGSEPSMRRLATELGVGTMTLYGYFRDRDDLLDAVVDAATEEASIQLPDGSWREQLAELMRGVRRTLARHPSGIRMRLHRPILSRGALRITEVGMQVLLGAGFGKAEAARAYRTLFIYTFGFAAFSSPARPEELRRQVRATLRSLPEEEYPELTAAAAEGADTQAGDAQFEFGLRVLLDGLEAELARSPRDR